MDLIDSEINILKNNINDEYIIFQHNILKNDLILGLQIVEDYIIDNDLMIVGGMAIDLALRAKHDNLYDEKYNIADFDIISPDNIDHANNVGSLLCDNKLKNISIIPAIHKTTVRVQMSGYTLFDATFVPSYIYDKIPHMLYKKIKFIDPIFQKIDQFMSLSFLFDITGAQYNIQHRLIKDDDRKKLLNEYYNLSYNKDDNIQSTDFSKLSLSLPINIFNNLEIKKIVITDTNNYTNTNVIYNKSDITNTLVCKYLNESKLNFDNIYYSIDCDITYHGTIAYNLIFHSYSNMINKLKSKNIIQESDLKIINDMDNNIKIRPIIKLDAGSNELSFSHFKELPITFINNNDNIDNILKNIKKKYIVNSIKNIENIAHKIPNNVTCSIKIDNYNYNLHIYDLYGRLLSTNIITIGDNLFNIANYNYILSYFLFNYYYANDHNIKLLYKCYYLSLLNIIECSKYIEDKYNEQLNEFDIDISWCKHSINTLGFNNLSDNYYYFIKNFNYLVMNNKNLNDLPPKNYIGYPNCKINKVFDDSTSPYYNNFETEIKNTNFAKDLSIQLNTFN